MSSRPLKIALWTLVVFVMIPVTVIAIAIVAPYAHSGVRHHPAYHCDSHTYKFGVGIRPYSATTAHAKLHAHVCTWTRRSHHATGQIIRHKTGSTIKWDVTSFGRNVGFEVGNHDKYRVTCNGFSPTNHDGCQQLNPWEESMGHWTQFRQCLLNACADTGNFVPFWRYVSPYLIHRSPDLQRDDKWDFSWHEGKPGERADGMDAMIKFTCWCW